MLSRPTQYAIQALAYLARQPAGSWVPIRRIGEEVGIPRPYLAKIVRVVARAGLLTSRPGPNGGVTLARDAGRIQLRQILAVFDEPVAAGRCWLGFDQCRDDRPCPMHEAWMPVRARLDRVLDEKRLSDLGRPGGPHRA